MSKEFALFLIVEGREIDTPFYEGLAKSSSRVAQRGYQIWLVEQITRKVPDPTDRIGSGRGTGGKAALMSLFDEYKASGVLAARNTAGKRSILFCTDRDLDDVAKTLRRSPHIVYTPMADAETTVYTFGNSRVALARATSLSEADIDDFLAAHPDWMNDLATRWRTWIELCGLASAHHAHCHVGTTKPSVVNDGKYGDVDQSKVASARQVIMKKSQFQIQEHPAINRRVGDRIRKTYAAGSQRKLLGKHWVVDYLHYLLVEYFKGAPVSLVSFKHKAPTAFLGELDFSGGWATSYRRKFEALV